MTRQYEIHDENGKVHSGNESEVSNLWMYLTKPEDVAIRLIGQEDFDKSAKFISNRKLTGTLSLLRKVSEHEQ